jgi:hypothetical protein
MFEIINEGGLSCRYETLEAAVEAALDYVLALMDDCDLSGRVWIMQGMELIRVVDWESF